MNYSVFLFICIAATFSPGPAVMLAIKNSASHGIVKAVTGIMGNVSAMLTLASLSAAGLGAVILASEVLFSAIKIIGGLYLIYLGLKAWNSRAALKASTGSDSHKQHKSAGSLYFEAYIVGISNPKAIAFYTALFPQFIDLNQAMLPQFLLLALTFAACSFTALTLYAIAAKQLSRYLLKETISRSFHRLTGGIFMGFGLSLIFSSRT